MNVVPIPCLTDNYAYWLPERRGIIDPSEAAAVLDRLDGASLDAVWCTHHHWDHVGGVVELAARFPGLKVYGSGRRPIEGLTHHLAEGDELDGVRIMAVPGHTLDALAFYDPDGDVFVGDTMFAMGCGRLFEGDAAMMFASLARLAALPPTTRVWFGHDYAEKNLAFTRSIVRTDRQALPPPATMGLEVLTNLFLRAADVDLAATLGTVPGVATFAALRRRRDHF